MTVQLDRTDNTGDPESNRKLSVDRAEAIKNMIVPGGIDDSRISTAGLGTRKADVINITTGSHAEDAYLCIRGWFACCFCQWQAAS